MDTSFEFRESESPVIQQVWRGQAGSNYAPICPASSQWHLLFLKRDGKTRAIVQGPLTRATPVAQAEGTEWVGITFPLGTFLSPIPVDKLLDAQATLPVAAKTSFELAGSNFQFPDYENVETFVEWLVREDLLVSDKVVKTVMSGHVSDIDLSSRTVRRRFLFATGLPHKTIEQIGRAMQASQLLEQGIALIDVAYQAGYADQAHMTRALKHFIGYTPSHIANQGSH